jgi:hypothetical protein
VLDQRVDLGLAPMVAGFGLSEAMPIMGAIMLYDGQPDLIDYDMTKGGSSISATCALH